MAFPNLRGAPRRVTCTASAAHKRMRYDKGPASDYPCDECGEPARDWAFDEPEGFSLDQSRYRPLCRPCHIRVDGRYLNLNTGSN